jgi:hypothetical protein
LHNEELNNLYSSPDIISKSSQGEWGGRDIFHFLQSPQFSYYFNGYSSRKICGSLFKFHGLCAIFLCWMVNFLVNHRLFQWLLRSSSTCNATLSIGKHWNKKFLHFLLFMLSRNLHHFSLDPWNV